MNHIVEEAAYADRILQGDVSEVLKKLPTELVHCIVTSPPYFGHRNYSNDNHTGEVGRERTVADYVARMVEIFREARRVLRNDGTLWLNLGDTYREGQLLGIPWRIALALQDDGWWLRSDVIWHKPNAMPSSVKTRPTTDHEYIFMLTKTGAYFYDADAIREPHVTFSEKSKMKGGRNHFGKRGGTPESGKNKGNQNLHTGRWDQAFHELGRNKRTVWSVPLGKCREAHFAVFPEALVEPCIKAGCPKAGIVLDPFLGSGTTAMVSRRLGRHYIGVELVPEYVELAKSRIKSVHFQDLLF